MLPQERSIPHHAVKAGNARPKRFQFGHQIACGGGKLPWIEFIGACSGALDDIGEADAVFQQSSIVRRSQLRDAKRTTRRFAEYGPGKRRPEPVGLAGEVMSLCHRPKRRVDADENDIKPVAQ